MDTRYVAYIVNVNDASPFTVMSTLAGSAEEAVDRIAKDLTNDPRNASRMNIFREWERSGFCVATETEWSFFVKVWTKTVSKVVGRLDGEIRSQYIELQRLNTEYVDFRSKVYRARGVLNELD